MLANQVYTLAVAKRVNKPATCDKTPTPLNDGNYQTFRTQDNNLDKTFGFVHNQTELWRYKIDWKPFGYPITNAERDGSTTTAYAEFHNLKKDTSSGWVPWAKNQCFVDDDALFDAQVFSATKVYVVRSSAYPCP